MRGDSWNYRGIISKMGYRHDNLSVGKVGMGGKKSDNDIYNYSGYFDGAYRINDNWELGAGARFLTKSKNSNDYFRKRKR